MRIFLAGATGVIGIRLVPLLVALGHDVAGMSRSEASGDRLRALGAQPVACDVYDLGRLSSAIDAFAPDLVMHQLTDLPDDGRLVPEHIARNERMRSEGTANLLAASGGAAVLAQSIAFTPVGGNDASVRAHEAAILEAGGVVLQYGLLYGPGTWFPDTVPPGPRIQVDTAARRTAGLLDAPSGVVVVVDVWSGPAKRRGSA